MLLLLRKKDLFRRHFEVADHLIRGEHFDDDVGQRDLENRGHIERTTNS